MTSSQSQSLGRGKLALGPALCGDIVIVVVGTEQKKYHIHRAVLIHHSEYFRNALKGPWKEAEEGVVPLADVEVETFDVFAQWIYSGTLPDDSQIDECSEIGTEIRWQYAKAFVFGDRFLAHQYLCAVYEKLNALIQMDIVWLYPNREWIEITNYFYENVPSHHPFLQQLAEYYRLEWCALDEHRKRLGQLDWIKNDYSSFSATTQRSLPPDFLIRVTQGIQQHGLDSDHYWYEKYCYIEHKWSGEKESCKKMHMSHSELHGYGFY
ncbi:hypothetical protein OPT61_g3482 [Boeremia exigua]|uniref:Uncharacterized protein n=1 Tax=Boeremia exigua TaxID=749465 RepID=A0ACC2IHT4_9PLEO|nr:hypothetical protein OPT61_g3482 [Boeremia exigua]